MVGMKVDGSNEVDADKGEKASPDVEPAVEVDGADETPPKTKGEARSVVGADEDDGGSFATSGAR